jgi:pilus assembly protein FimV
LQEEDPFAFDFGTPDADDGLDDFGSFDEDIASVDLPDRTADEEVDLSEDPESELESALDEDDSDDVFASFDEADDLSEPELDIDAEDGLDELDAFVEEDIPTMTPDVIEADIDSEGEIESEEESFVSSLLNDVDQEDTDEASIFSGTPNDSLANSIEETLAGAQQEDDEIEVPAFGEAEAAADEEVSDEEEEFDFFDASGDEAATKLDLARAYMDMGDEEGAKVILDDVIESGNEKQIAEAQNMMERMFPSD